MAILTAICCGAIVVVVYLGARRLRKYFQGGKYTKTNRIDGKIVIVTGSNTGIGKETVRELAKRGATVYMACRDMLKAEAARQEIVKETQNENVHCRHLDLASLKSVRSFVENFKTEQTRLDILINNAGIMRCPLMYTEDGFEMQLGVNHMGHFLLTNLLLDMLKNSAPSRIVVVSSIGHKRGIIKKDDLNSKNSYEPRAAYCQSKLANVLFTRELSRRLKGTGVTVNALHPGIVYTELGRHMSSFNRPLTKILAAPLIWLVLKTPKNGAQTTLYAALDPDLDEVSGRYFSDCKFKDVAPVALDDDMAKWLWAESVKWTKLDEEEKITLMD